MKQDPIKKSHAAVIYTRIASDAPGEGDAAHFAQEQRCLEHAGAMGHDIVSAFRDTGSGFTAARPGLNAMLTFLRERDGAPCRVLVTDLSRLTRDCGVQFQLLERLRDAGAWLEIADAERETEEARKR